MKSVFPMSFCIAIVLLGVAVPVKAQYVIKEADTQYELFNYVKAIDLYEQAYQKKHTLHAAERLASSYQLIQNYKEAESWYAIAVHMPGSPPENTLNYAKALQNNSKYTEAEAEFQQYTTQNTAVTAGQSSMWALSCDSARKWMQKPVRATITSQQSLNSAQSDWGAVPYQDGLVFVSDRVGRTVKAVKENRPFLKFDGVKVPDKKRYGWTGNAYQRLYLQQGGTDSVQLFPLPAGTDYHVGPASFTGDGSQMYFALTRIPEKEQYIKGRATINIEIYSSTKDEQGKWGAPVPFKYNRVNSYSAGDPYISKDGNSLYFVSDRPGGLGGTDIYVCLKTEAGDWGQPLNLKEVNTEGNERSPFFDTANHFYFSSDGRIGMGGLDMYSARMVSGKMSAPVNMGYPFNSPQDDFAYCAVTDSTGYFSSNRMEGLGADDIYHFTNPVVHRAILFRLKGLVYDQKTNGVLRNAMVTLSKTGGSSLKVQTNADGEFDFDLEKADYTLTGEKTGYRSDAAAVTTAGLVHSATLTKNLYLRVIAIDTAIRLENIYYDFNQWNIRKDAATELDKLVKIMKDNPTIWIELGSHTDSRGNDAYNMALSQKRAESSVQYIISRGIGRNRITAKGYGESRLLNRCANGVKCTVAEHQLNRRTEFKIVKQ